MAIALKFLALDMEMVYYVTQLCIAEEMWCFLIFRYFVGLALFKYPFHNNSFEMTFFSIFYLRDRGWRFVLLRNCGIRILLNIWFSPRPGRSTKLFAARFFLFETKSYRPLPSAASVRCLSSKITPSFWSQLQRKCHLERRNLYVDSWMMKY